MSARTPDAETWDDTATDGPAVGSATGAAREVFAVDGLEGLRERLARQAESHDLLDVAYRTVDSPVGPLLLAATTTGLVRVAYDREGFEEVLARIAALVSPRILAAPARLDAPARELEEYFAGTRHVFTVPLDDRLSRGLRPGFAAAVRRYLPQIGYGHTRSYGQVAAAVGRAAAVRAVGTACATNPLPLVVPCHRVVRADGTPGGYVGGAAAKSALLDLEAARRDC